MNKRTLFVNGDIWTGDILKPSAEAMVVENGRILEIGGTESLKNQFVGGEIIDLDQKKVLPGLHDSHMHLVNVGRMMEWVRLNECTSRQEVIAKCRNFADKNPEASIITGRGFLQDQFDDHTMPTRYDLDQVSQTKPVAIVRACGHIAVINSVLLRMAGIGKNYQFASNGQVDLDDEGEPLGILREGAMRLATSHYPKETRADVYRYIKNASRAAIASGLTSVQSNDVGNTGNEGWEKTLGAYQDWIAETPTGLRINHQLLFGSVEGLLQFHHWKQNEYGFQDTDRMSLGPVKLMCDGSLGGRTAHMLTPYADDASTIGLETLTQEEKNSILSLAHVLGYQMSGHAIGDAAIQGMLNAFESALRATPKRDARPRIIHAQLTTPAQLLQIQRLGVVIDAQPGFVGTDLHIVEKRIGKDRMKSSYAWKTLSDLGVILAGGSDAPVEPFNPFIGIGCAVTRQDVKGFPAGGWLPEQKLTVEQALRMYTFGSAFACFQEREKGRLMKGMLADFILVDRNIFAVDAGEIQDTKVLQTYIGGDLI